MKTDEAKELEQSCAEQAQCALFHCCGCETLEQSGVWIVSNGKPPGRFRVEKNAVVPDSQAPHLLFLPRCVPSLLCLSFQAA